MAYVIWKIFMKQYSRFRFDLATAAPSSAALLISRPLTAPFHLQQLAIMSVSSESGGWRLVTGILPLVSDRLKTRAPRSCSYNE
ncbi:unnamed protein product [Ceratitis capitata]|uniref:(Mediterranean fruit fly) hypothetical protein n=1 Tax=Ceratitis capitata TaxID=7213 RepID=A0A811UXQ0_CERCA|nr:unnamed protein product [Ceratitis capitata]